jgi:hypothetical protein
MLIFKLQKYGFYPINLLFLQVRPQKLQSHQKGSENILADVYFRPGLRVCGIDYETASAGADSHRQKSHQYTF